jgi:epoxyqueuosine reductase QueG
MAADIKRLMAAFDAVGIASRERFDDAPEQFHPRHLMPGFKSAIVFGQKWEEASKETAGGRFHIIAENVNAIDAATRHLTARGFGVLPVSARTKEVSLPRMGERAGLGEISGVNSLVFEEYGLAVKLGALLTDAPLRPDPLATGVCLKCWACSDACPVAKGPFQLERSECKSCGKCVEACPLTRIKVTEGQHD